MPDNALHLMDLYLELLEERPAALPAINYLPGARENIHLLQTAARRKDVTPAAVARYAESLYWLYRIQELATIKTLGERVSS